MGTLRWPVTIRYSFAQLKIDPPNQPLFCFVLFFFFVYNRVFTVLKGSKNKENVLAFDHLSTYVMHISLSRYDYLKITNEVNETFGMYCGERTGRTVTVTGDQVVMIFHSDQSIPKKGFLITLTTIPIGKRNTNSLCFLQSSKLSNGRVFFLGNEDILLLLEKEEILFFCRRKSLIP